MCIRDSCGRKQGAVMEYRSLYALGKEKLAAAGIPEADLDARLLLEYVCLLYTSTYHLPDGSRAGAGPCRCDCAHAV